MYAPYKQLFLGKQIGQFRVYRVVLYNQRARCKVPGQAPLGRGRPGEKMRIGIGLPLKMMPRPATALSTEKLPEMIRSRDGLVLAWERSPIAAKESVDRNSLLGP
jgi:hypothetical protein